MKPRDITPDPMPMARKVELVSACVQEQMTAERMVNITRIAARLGLPEPEVARIVRALLNV